MKIKSKNESRSTKWRKNSESIFSNTFSTKEAVLGKTVSEKEVLTKVEGHKDKNC